MKASRIALWTSPLVVSAVLLIASLVFNDTQLVVPTSLIWTIVALLSTTFAALIAKRTRRRQRLARRTMRPNNPWRIMTESNHTVASAVLAVHIIFLLVGSSALFLPIDSLSRVIVARDGLMVGQYILLMVVAHTYLEDRRAERIVGDEIDAE